MYPSLITQQLPPEDKSLVTSLLELGRGNWIISLIIGLYLVSYLDKLLKVFIQIPDEKSSPVSPKIADDASSEAQVLLGLAMLLVQAENDNADRDEEIHILNQAIKQLGDEITEQRKKNELSTAIHPIVHANDTGNLESCYDCHG